RSIARTRGGAILSFVNVEIVVVRGIEPVDRDVYYFAVPVCFGAAERKFEGVAVCAFNARTFVGARAAGDWALPDYVWSSRVDGPARRIRRVGRASSDGDSAN